MSGDNHTDWAECKPVFFACCHGYAYWRDEYDYNRSRRSDDRNVVNALKSAHYS